MTFCIVMNGILMGDEFQTIIMIGNVMQLVINGDDVFQVISRMVTAENG